MSRTETWEHKRVMRSKRKQDWYYSCTATQWWGTATESASFNYTDGGKAKMQAWQDKYLEADWRVSIKLVRGKK